MSTSLTSRPARFARGFTLIELMVGMAVGLLVTLAIAAVLVNAENQRRTTTTGSDAQINGGLAIYTIERQLKMAGYGITLEAPTNGCTLTVQSGGAAVAGAPPVLAPVMITAGANGAPDSVRILGSSQRRFVTSVPLKTTFYNPAGVPNGSDQRFDVQSTLGVREGDLMALVYGGTNPNCEVFQAGTVTPPQTIARIDSGTWNANRFPTLAATASSYLVNLGELLDITYSITADQRLRQTSFNLPTQSAQTQDMQSNIVTMKALYAKDALLADGVVDTFDTTLPATNAEWLQLRGVRLAVVARSAQYEKEEVTTANPLWDVGTAANVAGAVTCGSSRCLTLKVDGAQDWRHYRYKVFELLVPLRNQIWRADLP